MSTRFEFFEAVRTRVDTWTDDYTLGETGEEIGSDQITLALSGDEVTCIVGTPDELHRLLTEALTAVDILRPEPSQRAAVMDEDHEALAGALAETYTSEHGARNPAWDVDQPDGPDNPHSLTRPMAERIDSAPYVIFTDHDGCRSIRMPSCAELAGALLPVVDAIARRRAAKELRAAAEDH
jgi:hypothetical protein